jgi:hypothetical protein
MHNIILSTSLTISHLRDHILSFLLLLGEFLNFLLLYKEPLDQLRMLWACHLLLVGEAKLRLNVWERWLESILYFIMAY